MPWPERKQQDFGAGLSCGWVRSQTAPSIRSGAPGMAGKIDAKLQALGITLPTPMAPIANYVAFVRSGDLVIVSGQVPAVDGKIAITGKVGDGLTIAAGQHAARLCFINIMVHLKAACGGDLDRVQQVVR